MKTSQDRDADDERPPILDGARRIPHNVDREHRTGPWAEEQRADHRDHRHRKPGPPPPVVLDAVIGGQQQDRRRERRQCCSERSAGDPWVVAVDE